MTTDLQSARDDLAFLRGLVDDNWRPGLWLFGALYVSVGAVICAHVFVTWAAHAGLLPLKQGGLIWFYVVLYGVFSVLWTWISLRSRRTGHPASPGVKNRTGGGALAGAFAGHLVMLGALVIVAIRQGNSIFVELAPLVLFTLQGALWFVIHALRRERWQLLEAWGWFAATLALAPLVGTEAYGPGVGLAVIVLMIIPGVVMLRAARAAA